MQLEKIACNSCGAPLEVAATARFATCRHCGTQLSIQRTETATFTEVIEKLTATTEKLSEKINTLTGHSELAALDREWELEQQKYLILCKDGDKHIPTGSDAIAGGIFITLFGGFWTIMAFSMTSMAPSFGPFAIAKLVFPLVGILFVIGGIFTSITAWNKAEQYRHAESRYRNRRSELQAGDR